MLDRPDPCPRPEWLQKIMAAKAAALAALTPAELAEAEAEKAARRARVEARRLASIERAKTIFAMFADGHSDVEIGRVLNCASRAVRRFAELRGYTITRSKISVRRLVALSCEHETHLRALADAQGLAPAAALEQLVGLILSDEAAMARRMLRNPDLAREAIAAAFGARGKSAA